MVKTLQRNEVRNIVYHVFADMIDAKALVITDELDEIVSQIKAYIIESDCECHDNVIREFVVERVLETFGINAFGLYPVFDAEVKTRPVTEILNEMVAQGKLSKHWETK